MAGEAARTLTTQLGVDIDPELLVLALTHRSFAYEQGGLPTNERLEFLGDAVLGVIATDRLYRSHPDAPEGDLARMRAASVSQKALAAIARSIDLGSYLLLGKGEISTGGSNKDSILSDALEALIAAVYLCHGIETTTQVVLRLIEPTLQAAAALGAGLDWKTSLQELAAATGHGVPRYETSWTGPDHDRMFFARVLLDDVEFGAGSGSAKKLAEHQAAEQAYQALNAGTS